MIVLSMGQCQKHWLVQIRDYISNDLLNVLHGSMCIYRLEIPDVEVGEGLKVAHARGQ